MTTERRAARVSMRLLGFRSITMLTPESPVPKQRQLDPSEYWAARVSRSDGLGEVGHRSLGPAYNAVIYRRRLEVLSHALRACSIQTEGRSVLDVGCGTGYYLPFWAQRSVGRLVGLDVSESAVERLTERFPAWAFHARDLARPDWSAGIPGPFWIATLFDVVYHVLDDRVLARLFLSLAELLEPAGVILMTEAAVTARTSLVRHVAHREPATWQRILEPAGLRVESRFPLFQLLEPPLSHWRALSLSVAAFYAAMGFFLRRSARFATRVAELLSRADEKLLLRGSRLANHELWVVRRAEPLS